MEKAGYFLKEKNMAKLDSYIMIKVDNFFTNTRIRICLRANCKHHKEGGNCNLKTVVIDSKGLCRGYDPSIPTPPEKRIKKGIF